MSDELHLSHIARVRLVTPERFASLKHLVVGRGYSTEEEANDLFYWDAEISNDLLDSHFTHMNAKTLKNYEEDTREGIAFMRSHNWHELPVGYSLHGTYEEGDRNRVIASFYTDPGISEAVGLIQRMKSGILRDVSVGFHGGRAICDLCGQDFWDCRHFPGLKYEEKQGDTVTTKLATFTIDDARLSEVSGVFDGSTPQAMILKAERAAKAGQLTVKQATLLEQRYRVRLPLSRSFAIPQGEEISMTAEERLASIRTLFGVVTDDEIEQRLTDLNGKLDIAQKRVAELEPQAKDGAEYRNDLIESALAEGVRAQGADFDRTTYEGLLKGAPLATIKRMRDDWAKTAGASLPAGRQSTDGEGNAQREVVSTVPISAYKA